MRKITALAAFGAAAAAAQSASSADTLGTTINITAQLVAGCTQISANSPTFASTLTPGLTPIASGDVSVTCTSTTPAIIQFTSSHAATVANSATGAVIGSAQLSNSAATATLIAYSLFSSAAPTIVSTLPVGTSVVLGTKTGAGITITGAGSAVVTPVWAATNKPIPNGLPSGQYTDPVTVTLTF